MPGQRFPILRSPIVPGDEPAVLEVSGDEGWQEWSQVSDFAGSGPADKDFALDVAMGEVVLSPAVRLDDGDLRQYGAVPAKGARLRLREYRTGGGRRGNVAARSLTVLKASIPFVARVEIASQPAAVWTARTSRTPRSVGRSGADARAGRDHRGFRASRARGGAR